MAQPKKSGSIPQNLTLFARDETHAGFRWEDVEGGDIKHKVRPVYISDSTNAKTKETGLNWMNQSYGDYVDGKWITRKNIGTIIETPNTPISNIQIVTLEIRDKGGRAYKCMADIGSLKNAYFDMREDVLLDCMFQQGIQLGGVCEGPFIFARVDSQMKPVRIGSLLHTKMIEATEHNQKKAIKDYEVGGVYANKAGDEAVYLGIGYTRTAKGWNSHSKVGNWNYRPNLKHRIDYPEEKNYYYTTVGISKSEKRHIFLEKAHANDGDKNWARVSRYNKESWRIAYIKLVKSPTYKDKTGQIEIDPKIYDWVFDLTKTRHTADLDNLSREQGFIHPIYSHLPEL